MRRNFGDARLLWWEAQQFLFVLASFIQMFLINHIQIDSICKALLAVLVDEAWWQNLWHFLILPRPCSCVVSWRMGP